MSQTGKNCTKIEEQHEDEEEETTFCNGLPSRLRPKAAKWCGLFLLAVVFFFLYVCEILLDASNAFNP